MENSYHYIHMLRQDILDLVPETGVVIGSIGCGQAKTEEMLVQSGRIVHGVDISSQAIEVAKGRISSARVVNTDEIQPFEESSLDGLILADVLEHLPLGNQRLASYVKMVKRGGG